MCDRRFHSMEQAFACVRTVGRRTCVADQFDWTDIVLDSGSDVSMLPVVFGDAGSATSNPNIPLFDAQGGVIPVQDCRRVDIELQASGGSHPILRESCHVGDVGQPLMSFGRMMLKQWSIHADPEGGHLLTHPSGVSAPIFLKGWA